MRAPSSAGMLELYLHQGASSAMFPVVEAPITKTLTPLTPLVQGATKERSALEGQVDSQRRRSRRGWRTAVSQPQKCSPAERERMHDIDARS